MWQLWCSQHTEDRCTPKDYEEMKKGMVEMLRRAEQAGIFVLKPREDGQVCIIATEKFHSSDSNDWNLADHPNSWLNFATR
jgi:hypothetical protein